MRALLAVAGSLTFIAGLLTVAVVVSPVANAATHDVAVTCDANLGDIVIYGDIGDTFAFALDSTCTNDRLVDWVDWELNNSLIYNWNEDEAKPGLLAFVDAVNYPDINEGSPAWWVESDGSGTTVIRATLLSASLVNATYTEAVPLTRDGKVAQIDNNLVDVVTKLPTAGFKSRNIIWGGTSGGDSGDKGAASATAPTPTFALNSSSADRGSCWPTVSGASGTWVRLTASGCTPPSGRNGATLLGWATSPHFPVARAANGVVVDEVFGGVRMIFIPINGYTLLSGDNTLYPIWSEAVVS